MFSTYRSGLTFDKMTPHAGLRIALSQSPAEALAVVDKSKLRGRGGAGFMTGAKLNTVVSTNAAQKYIICNADEGEPGTFKDRVLLEYYLNFVIDGMKIAAHITGATVGYIYLRGEYSYLCDHIQAALVEQIEQTDCDFFISLRLGAGAYICGEETSLIESMEGKRGEPRDRPPFPSVEGYNGCPTVVDNVETFAWLAAVMEYGSDWFLRAGTEASKGYKLYSISGDCERPGVYQVPYGVTIQAMLDVAGVNEPKAVQVGGASGVCLCPDEFNRTLSFEDISSSGSIIVFGAKRDMLSIALNFMEFFVEESCGQCTPCREGATKLLSGLRMIEEGTCSVDYLNSLISLSETITVASKCGLGQAVPRSFLSIVSRFKHELLGRPSLSIVEREG